MPKQLLRDVNIFPTFEVIHEALGEAPYHMNSFCTGCQCLFPKCHLTGGITRMERHGFAKAANGKRLYFGFLFGKAFSSYLFFFTEKTCSGVMDLEIAEELKMQLQNAAMVGKLIPLICDMSEEYQLEDLFTVMKYKAALK